LGENRTLCLDLDHGTNLTCMARIGDVTLRTYRLLLRCGGMSGVGFKAEVIGTRRN
jgi:hypothetical protein